LRAGRERALERRARRAEDEGAVGDVPARLDGGDRLAVRAGDRELLEAHGRDAVHDRRPRVRGDAARAHEAVDETAQAGAVLQLDQEGEVDAVARRRLAGEELEEVEAADEAEGR